MARSGPVTVLGIDPGLTCTGYGVVIEEGSSHRCLAFGAVAPPAKAPHPERLMRIHDAISDVIREHRPQEVAIEDFIIGHTRAAVAIGEARAVAILAAGQAGLPVALYKPTEVKQFVTSYGRGSKEQVALMVQALLSLSEAPAPPDAADALAVALCHCLRRGSALATIAPPPVARTPFQANRRRRSPAPAGHSNAAPTSNLLPPTSAGPGRAGQRPTSNLLPPTSAGLGRAGPGRAGP